MHLLRGMNGLPISLVTLGWVITVSALFCIIFTKTVTKNCSLNTSLISLGISIIGAVGAFCFFRWLLITALNKASEHPVEYLAAISLGAVSFMVFCLLIAFYVKKRLSFKSAKGVIIDICLALICSPAFLLLFNTVYHLFD